jgi:type I restriction enzyme S subunit
VSHSQRLDAVCEIAMGQAPSGDAYNYDGKGWPLIAGAGDFGETYPVCKKYTTAAARLSKYGDIVLGIRASIGEKVIADGEYCLGRGVAGLRGKSNLDSSYLWHWLTHTGPVLASKAKGATFKQVNKDDIGELEIILPALPEQRRIAAILDQADALRVKRREALAQLDSLTQSIFIEMFGDPATNTATLNFQPLESLLEDSFQNGAYFPKETYCESAGTEMVHMSDAFGGCVRRGNLKRVNCSDADIKKYTLTTHDILIARRSLTYEGAAKPCMIPHASEPLIFESSFIRVRPNRTKITPLYLFHYLNNDRVKKTHIRPYVTQSTISGINQSNLAQVPVLQPPLELQHKFGVRVQSIENMRRMQGASLSELNTLFASLQHRAFRGEL